MLEPYYSDNPSIKDKECLSLDISANFIDDSGFMSLGTSLNKINCISELRLGENYKVTEKGIVKFLSALGVNCTLTHLDLRGLFIPHRILHIVQRFLFRNVFLNKVTLSFDFLGINKFFAEKHYITKYFGAEFIGCELEEDYGFRIGYSKQEVRDKEKGRLLWKRLKDDMGTVDQKIQKEDDDWRNRMRSLSIKDNPEKSQAVKIPEERKTRRNGLMNSSKDLPKFDGNFTDRSRNSGGPSTDRNRKQQNVSFALRKPGR